MRYGEEVKEIIVITRRKKTLKNKAISPSGITQGNSAISSVLKWCKELHIYSLPT